MGAAARQQYANTAAIAAAGIIAAGVIAPAPPLPSWMNAVERQLRLVSVDDSLANVPLNLFYDVANIPHTEVGAVDILAGSLLNSGNWWTPSATNIWGTDPGDVGHYMGLIDMAIPFQQISGQNQPEIPGPELANGTAGLAQQLSMLAAAELPTSAACDADYCSPLTPTTEITGFTPIDRDIWFLSALSGSQHFPLFNNWLTVPLSNLTSGNFTFNSTTDPSGIADPNNGVASSGSVPTETYGGSTFEGTTPGPNGANLMPWAGDTFKLNPLGPLENFSNSLTAAPPTDGIGGTGLEVSSPTDAAQALQALMAGTVVAFDPFVDGSPACLGTCDVSSSDTMQGLVQTVSNLSPGNPLVDHWLNLYNTPSIDPLTGDANPTGMANGATQQQADNAIAFLQGNQNVFDMGNPSPADPPTDVPFSPQTPDPFPVSASMQGLINLMHASGEQGLAQELANLAGYTPIYTSATTTSSAADMLSELLGQGTLLQQDLLSMATLGLM